LISRVPISVDRTDVSRGILLTESADWYVHSVENGDEKGHGGYRTQREARAAAKALEVDASRGRYMEPSGRTLADWYTEWSATRNNLSPTRGASRASCGG
jgi:hypothetical protein